MLYVIISFSAVYVLSLMAMYSLSAILNLIHLKKNRNADYIVVIDHGKVAEIGKHEELMEWGRVYPKLYSMYAG